MKPTIKWSLQIFVLAGLVLSSVGCSGQNSLFSNTTSDALKASGTIEAETIKVAAELSGKVKSVEVNEGQSVSDGEILLQLDDSLYQAQVQIAQAGLSTAQKGVQSAQTALDSAQMQYDVTLSNALANDLTNRTADWKLTKPTEYDLPTWYYSNDEQYQATQAALDAAAAKMDQDVANLDSTLQKAGSAQFVNAEKRLSDARVAFTLAKALFDKTNGASSGQDLRDAAQDLLDDARTELDDAQQAYDEALTTDGAKDVLTARARVEISRERLAMAQDSLRAMQTGERSPQVMLADSAVKQARAGVDQAQSQVVQAQANLDLLNAQVAKLTISAPQDGVVLTRSVQPGEVIQAGMTVLSIAKLDQLKVTVYIPENQYGQVGLGEGAELSIDSFPGQTFKATVTRIADQAEFTPRNVQTQEQRQTTVYAVELSIDNPDGVLKPGMPVDVTFSPGL